MIEECKCKLHLRYSDAAHKLATDPALRYRNKIKAGSKSVDGK